jgi:hypothetical protein
MNAPKTEPEVLEPEVGRSHDLFTDPSLSQNIKEDPVARFISKHWKNILTAVCAGLVIFYMREQVLETSLARVKESSLVFDQARAALEVLTDKSSTASAEEKEKLSRSLRDSLANLSSGSEPYLSLSKLYSVIAESNKLLESETSSHSAEALNWSMESDSTKRLLAELSVMVVLRNKLDLKNDDSQAISSLKQLAKDGQFADLSSFLLLSKLAQSEEDKIFLKQVSADMITRYPAQKAKIEAALSSI